MSIDWKALAAPFPENELEWRIGQAGKKADGKIWCKVLAYLNVRMVQDRLDAVCGADGWYNEYQAGPMGGVVCGISIRVNRGDGTTGNKHDHWITKWDGAGNTDVEQIKGGLSDSMKRAAVQWGIGRYLYGMDNGFAEVSDTQKPGYNYANCKVKSKGGGEEWAQFYWKPPKIGEKFLPGHEEDDQPPPPSAPQASPERVAFNKWANELLVRYKDEITPDYIGAVVRENKSNYPAARKEIEATIRLKKGLADGAAV